MKLLVLADSLLPEGRRLREALVPLQGHYPFEFFEHMTELAQGLQKPIWENRVVVALIADRASLLDLVKIRNYFRDIPCVLILPDLEETTLTLGHFLRPRFMTEHGADFHELTMILEKLLQLRGGHVTPQSKNVDQASPDRGMKYGG